MNCLESFEVTQISSFGESQLISRELAACSCKASAKSHLSMTMCPKLIPLIDVFVFKYVLFVFLDYRQALIDVKWDHSSASGACDILYPIEK